MRVLLRGKTPRNSSLAITTSVLLLLLATNTGATYHDEPSDGECVSEPDEGLEGWDWDHVVYAQDNEFVDAETGLLVTEISVGDTVRWFFPDTTNNPHTVTFDLKDEDSRFRGCEDEPEFDPSDSSLEPILVTFDEPGTYTYFCQVHNPFMRGITIIVD